MNGLSCFMRRFTVYSLGVSEGARAPSAHRFLGALMGALNNNCRNILTTAVLPKIPHSNSCKRVPNRPLRPRRGRFGTLLQQLECGIFGRTAVRGRPSARRLCLQPLWARSPGCRCPSGMAGRALQEVAMAAAMALVLAPEQQHPSQPHPMTARHL